jgi:hypothetical protein
MKHTHAALAVAIAAVLSAPVFAQSSTAPAGVTNDINANNSANTAGNNVSITSGRGAGASQGANASVTVIPSTQTAVPTANLKPGGVMFPAGSTTVLGGPSGDASGTQTVTTRYWVNVPANAQNNGDFQRWQKLR